MPKDAQAQRSDDTIEQSSQHTTGSLKPLIFSDLPWATKAHASPDTPIINVTTLNAEKTEYVRIGSIATPEHYKLQQALFNSGFFYIENYGINESELEEFCNVSRAFLSKDEAYKKQFYYDQAMHGYAPLGTESIAKATKTGEYIDYCQKISWQKNKTMIPNAEFAKRWSELFNKLTLISKQLLDHIVTVLELNSEQVATLKGMLEGEGILRYLHYNFVPQSYQEPIRLAPHHDLGFITLLFQVPAKNGVPSLEAKINGEYKSIPPIRNTIVVNLGEALSYISGNKIKATMHKVSTPAEGSRGPDSERTSIPFFFTPKSAATLTRVTQNSTYDVQKEGDQITFAELLNRVLNQLHVANPAPSSTIKSKL